MDPTKYTQSRDLYYERKSLPFNDPNVIFDMSGWLQIYQMEDVVPLVQAVQNQSEHFWNLFEIDAHVHNSLPSMAMAAMFANYDETMPLCYTFGEKFDEERADHRDGIVGGLTAVYGRHVDLSGGTDSPLNARTVPNGDDITAVDFHDANG